MPVDPSKPSSGRIYDYMLGGHHNYEADRQAAAALLKVVPTYPKWARLNRWFLQLVAGEWEKEGRSEILDLGSGLPTLGHFNELLPNARILFSDIDPLTVAYGEDLLKSQPHMRYVQADLGQPAPLVEQAGFFFDRSRRLAVGCIGVAYLLPDEHLHRLAAALHAFCAPGSVMALTSLERSEAESARWRDAESAADSFKRHAAMNIRIRTPRELAQVLAPWQITVSRPLPEWLNVPDIFSAEEQSTIHAYLGGVLLVR